VLEAESRCVQSVSATTRKPRAGEVDGKDYFFVSLDEFERKKRDGELIEWAEFAGNFYGTPRAFIEKAKAHGDIAVLDIDIQGAAQIRRTMPDAVTIFVAPPSLAALEQRLRARKTETEEAIARRLARVPSELAAAKYYDYLVWNDRVENAVQAVLEVIRVESRRISRMDLEGDWLPKV
ncbi:MAG TPA: guanylate kinase, partial [Candidatus Latescibacteria bacterium]|nr:guanylate kinase [Candidatus Latescibacterota bacterium]